jgi:hypothetical protein
MQRTGLTMLITVLLLSATVICAAFLFGTHENRINVRNPKCHGLLSGSDCAASARRHLPVRHGCHVPIDDVIELSRRFGD